MPEERPHPLLLLLHKFWSPVPWMLEATLLLELVLGKYTQAVIIAVLLVLNAVLSFLQERRASNALQLLRQHLTVQARVLRDGRWQLVLAQDLVPGDVVHVRMGDLAPADVILRDGQILVDQSALTGESAPVEFGPGNTAFAGSTVRRGEATGEVAATGPHTRFGKTAELVRTSRTPSHLEALIFTVVKYLVALDVVLVVAILVYAVVGTIPLAEIIPFALILLVASVPVALPATYTLASATRLAWGMRRRRASRGPASNFGAGQWITSNGWREGSLGRAARSRRRLSLDNTRPLPFSMRRKTSPSASSPWKRTGGVACPDCSWAAWRTR